MTNLTLFLLQAEWPIEVVITPNLPQTQFDNTDVIRAEPSLCYPLCFILPHSLPSFPPFLPPFLPGQFQANGVCYHYLHSQGSPAFT